MHPEQQYLDLIARIVDRGFFRPSPHQPIPSQPTPPGTITLINQNMEFDLSTGQFPLMTVRRVGFKAVVAELLWFLSGSTNNYDLHDLGTHLWDPWDTPETNQAIGWAPGQLGPIYGKQWRHWGARMSKPDGKLDRPGFDQIERLVRGLVESPNSKRNYVTAYDPEDMDDCFVTTCHGLFFCQVWGDRLHMHTVQRSADVPVGVPFNVASYSLLLLMLAQVTGLKPGTLYHTLSDAHLYENQVGAMKELLLREPRPYPRVRLNPSIQNLFDFKPADFEVIEYEPHAKLEVEVAT